MSKILMKSGTEEILTFNEDTEDAQLTYRIKSIMKPELLAEASGTIEGESSRYYFYKDPRYQDVVLAYLHSEDDDVTPPLQMDLQKLAKDDPSRLLSCGPSQRSLWLREEIEYVDWLTHYNINHKSAATPFNRILYYIESTDILGYSATMLYEGIIMQITTKIEKVKIVDIFQLIQRTNKCRVSYTIVPSNPEKPYISFTNPFRVMYHFYKLSK